MRKRIAIVAGVLATLAALAGPSVAQAAPSCSGVLPETIVLKAHSVDVVDGNFGTATCTTRWTVVTWLQFEAGGTWFYPEPPGVSNTSGTAFDCQYDTIDGNWDFKDCFSNGTANSFFDGFFGSGNQGTWRTFGLTAASNSPQGIYNVCDFNWRVVFQIYNYFDGSPIGATHSSETQATNCV